MDLELLVIGDTCAGWNEAIAAAETGCKVGLVSIPRATHETVWDLRQCPDDLLREACTDWALTSADHRSRRRPADANLWQEFLTHTRGLWQHQLDLFQDRFLTAGGQVWTGSVMLTGAHSAILTSPGRKPCPLRADQLLIATGTAPRRPSFAVGIPTGLHEAARLLDLTELPNDACVIGGGVTGLRAACLLAWWGAAVRIIDGRLIATEGADDETVSLLNWAEKLGVEFELGEDVIGLRALSGRERIGLTLETGRQVRSNSVWLATARRGRTDDLRLEHARLTADDHGRLWCGPQQRTWIPSIRAAGDVVGYAADSVEPDCRIRSEIRASEIHHPQLASVG